MGDWLRDLAEQARRRLEQVNKEVKRLAEQEEAKTLTAQEPRPRGAVCPACGAWVAIPPQEGDPE